MNKVKFSELSGRKVNTSVHSKGTGNNENRKLRKGRVTLLFAFIFFLILDVFLITEYKLRGVNAIGYQFMETVNTIFESGGDLVSSIWKPELKNDGRFTSMLIVGIDTRDVEFTGTEFVSTDPEGQHGTRNTDTLIQVIYDHSNGKIFMISIPRDMGIDVEEECLDFHGSLHWVYDKGQAANCPGGGVQTLTDAVEGITGIEIQYYAFISLEAFVDLINAVGDVDEHGERGIWIDVPETIYELYPINDYGWESVYFEEGYQFLTAEEALKYARSRKASSDFSRARRQQIVIEAVKNWVVSSDTLLNPNKVYSLYETFQNNVLMSKLSLEEIRAGLNLARDLDSNEIINVVLDPELGGHEVLINKQPHDRLTAQYYMVPTDWRDCPGNEFCKVQEFINAIIEHPAVWEEQANIYVYGREYDITGKPDLENQTYKDAKNSIPATIIEYKYTVNYDTNDSIVLLDFSGGEKSETLRLLSEKLGVEVTDGSNVSYIQSGGEDIAIIVSS